MQRIGLPVALALILSAGGPEGARGQEADTPGQLLELWLEALERQDHAAYQACLHSGARPVPEYGSAEAMEFWAGEIRDLVRDGFDGRFEIEPVAEPGGRFPPGAVRAFPIVGGRRVDDAIVLVPENGRWKIARIFS
jgi:hypothetical protein